MATTTTTTTTPVAKPVNFTNQSDVLAAVARIKELKAAELAGEAAKKERKALEESVILPALNGAQSAIVRGVTLLKLSSVRKTHLWDTKLLKEAFPEAAEAIYSFSEYQFITYS